MNKTYIAKAFLSVYELVEELGYEIPAGTKLYDRDGRERGTYLEHVDTLLLYHHLMQSPTMRTTPFPDQDMGIFIEIGFDKRVIDNQLLANDKTRMV